MRLSSHITLKWALTHSCKSLLLQGGGLGVGALTRTVAGRKRMGDMLSGHSPFPVVWKMIFAHLFSNLSVYQSIINCCVFNTPPSTPRT